MKKSFLIGIIVIVSLCVGILWYTIFHFHYEMSRVIEIRGTDPQTWQVVSRGMGYLVDATTVITSAHVVPDDRSIYKWLQSGREVLLTVWTRFSGRDIALLTLQKSEWEKELQSILPYSDIRDGDAVIILVSRSGAIVRLDGKVKNPEAQVLAYDQNGEVKVFSGIVLTDTPFLPWDSGAPIFTEWGKLIDVVHVSEK